jgi:hypothetical protein
MGKVPFHRRRVEWKTVETWVCEVLEDGHEIASSIALIAGVLIANP